MDNGIKAERGSISPATGNLSPSSAPAHPLGLGAPTPKRLSAFDARPRPEQASSAVAGARLVRVLFSRSRVVSVLLAVAVFAVGMVVAADPVSADHVESREQGDITGDDDELRTYGGHWYKGEGGDTGRDGFWYTYDPDSYAYWYFGDLRGVYIAENFFPGRDATKNNSCGILNTSCQARPPTASPHYRVWERDDDGNWSTIYDWRTGIRDSDGDYKTGWWGWNDVKLDGYIVVEVRKRYDDNDFRLAADRFRFRWSDLLPDDRNLAIAFCRANALNEVVQYKSVYAVAQFTKEVSKLLLSISAAYFVGLGLANLPTALASAIGGIKAIKTGADLARVAKGISDAIKVFQNVPTTLQVIQNALGFASELVTLTDDIVDAGVLGENRFLYDRYKRWCSYAEGTVIDWSTGQVDLITGRGAGGGCYWYQRWTCVSGYLDHVVAGHP